MFISNHYLLLLLLFFFFFVFFFVFGPFVFVVMFGRCALLCFAAPVGAAISWGGGNFQKYKFWIYLGIPIMNIFLRHSVHSVTETNL